MATNKNQHFVPKCHFKPFTLGEAGKAIQLFNLERARAIPDTPTKGQCSRDYFYGEDLRLERALQAFEGDYAAVVQAVREPGYRLTDDHRAFLAQAWLLQHLRTESSSLRMVQMMEQLDEDVGGLPVDYRLTLKEAVQDAMNVFFAHPDQLSDLRVCLVRNETARPFITSDNPAVMTNRWHLTDRRAALNSPGLQNAGMTGFLPLTPEILCVLYDGDLHSLAHTGGWASVRREDDVEALNQHQVLNSAANLYFRDWEDRAYVAEVAALYVDQRLPARWLLHHAILESEAGGVKTYRRVSAQEARYEETSMIHYEAVIPTPTRWPSILRWRSGGFVYDSGTGQGYARRAQRGNQVAYTKVKVRS